MSECCCSGCMAMAWLGVFDFPLSNMSGAATTANGTKVNGFAVNLYPHRATLVGLTVGRRG
jgi:hypothetical protein